MTPRLVRAKQFPITKSSVVFFSQEDLLGAAWSRHSHVIEAGMSCFPRKNRQIFSNEDTQERITACQHVQARKNCGVKWGSVFPLNQVMQ